MRKICPLHHLPSSFVFVIFTLYFHTMARTTNILVVALVLGIATSVRAHTCLLDPLQRNGAPGALTKVADPACGLNAAPCGGTKVGSPSASYQAGTTASITWVKNLNHYNSAAPGTADERDLPLTVDGQRHHRSGDVATLLDPHGG